MESTNPFGRFLLSVAYAVALAACSGPQTKDFAVFANAGHGFVEQAPHVYDYAFVQEVNADSAQLMADRQLAITLNTSGRALEQTLIARDDLFRQRLDQFNIMKKHALFLRGYFIALGTLASDAQAAQAGQAADNFAMQLGSLAPAINNITIKDTPISGLFKPITQLGVSVLQNKFLKEHLEQHGATVWNAIGLQREMFVELRKLERDEESKIWRQREKVELAKPIADLQTTLPPSWGQQRLALLTISSSETPITAAIEAAEGLQQNLQSLSHNQSGAIDQLERSIMWIDALLNAIEISKRGVKQ